MILCRVFLVIILFLGGYGVRNNKKTRDFLKMWSNLELNEPKGFHSADNGAIHVALMKWFIGANNKSVKQCIKGIDNRLLQILVILMALEIQDHVVYTSIENSNFWL